MTYYQPFQVTGFHSCDKDVGLKVLNGEMDLKPSENSWDWLGSGIYFWEQNPGRALLYANESAEGKQKNKTRIVTPFVLGAVIELGHCLNLVEHDSLETVKHAYNKLSELYLKAGRDMPAFLEGGPIYTGASFTDRLHIELCVINKELIKGYFLPRPIPQFNPNLKKAA
ncbi:MAG: hypothetical protein JST68_21330 [Bacteroidetes bacterium]|nr:hypothetical protein [Bacteroidota bacterium]